MTKPSHVAQLAYAWGKPVCSGILRSRADDFIVDEQLGFEPDGQGEHVFLQIRKRDTNTGWLAKKLSEFAAVKDMDVSYSGLKDRNAVTTQWFSIKLAGKAEPDWQVLNSEQIEILRQTRNSKKLRRGTHKGNRFEIIIRNVDCSESELQYRLEKIGAEGVPNYFTEQRFGHGESNIKHALEMFAGKKVKNRRKRSLYLSAARSYLFNEVLSKRVADANWNDPLNGDAMMLDGTHSYFLIGEQSDTPLNEDIILRCREKDIHPSGAMWGRGEPLSREQVLALEQAQFSAEDAQLRQGLGQAGLKQERRTLRLMPTQLSYEIMDGEIIDRQNLKIVFKLPTGSYATAVIRELLDTTSLTTEQAFGQAKK